MCKDNLNCNIIYLDIRLTYNIGVIPISKTILYKGYFAPIISAPTVLEDYTMVFVEKPEAQKLPIDQCVPQVMFSHHSTRYFT